MGIILNNPGDNVLVSSPFQFQARLALGVSAVEYKLAAYNGSRIVIGNSAYDLTTTGISNETSANLLAADGTDSGGAMAVSTLYYMYASDADATFAPGQIRGSATAPNLGLDGVYRLGAAGNASHWLYVGALYVDSAGNILDTPIARHICSYYNPLPLSLRRLIGYVDDNANTNFTLNNAAFGPINAGTDDFVSYVDLGQNPIDISLHASIASQGAAAGGGVGIADNSTTGSLLDCQTVANSAVNVGVSVRTTFKNSGVSRRTANALGYTNSVNMVFRADVVRTGAAADPPQTVISGIIYG